MADPSSLYDATSSSPTAVDGRVVLTPGRHTEDPARVGPRIRVMWGQPMIPDLLEGRYRAVVCGVNDEDNASGIISPLVRNNATSQWNARSVTKYAKMFAEAVADFTEEDDQPYILKYDLDSILVLALLRPKDRTFFTLSDLGRGFRTATKMLEGRRERLPVASVSFLGAKSNPLFNSEDDQREPSFEAVLRTMYGSGFRGDVYPPQHLWSTGDEVVHPGFPFESAS